MNNNLIMKFLDEHQYDIRVSGNGRWIDQKCAFDAVCFVADCIMDYIQNGGRQPFQSPDIWHSEYAITNVQNIFCKPDPLKKTALDEYNTLTEELRDLENKLEKIQSYQDLKKKYDNTALEIKKEFAEKDESTMFFLETLDGYLSESRQ